MLVGQQPDENLSLQGLSSPVVQEVLRATGDWTEVVSPLTDGKVSWRPVLQSVDGSQVLHIHLAEELRPYIRNRLEMAVRMQMSVAVALRLPSLYDSDMLEFLVGVDAAIMLIDSRNCLTISNPVYVLTALSDNGVPVEREVRSSVARVAWDRLQIGDENERGRRFEGLLAFLLSQVSDFRVREKNLRGATDEMDLVLQIDNWSGRCWYQPGVPFVLVEAKNWKKPVGQPIVTLLHGRLRKKRQRARVGLAMTTSRFTSDAAMEELKYAGDRHGTGEM